MVCGLVGAGAIQQQQSKAQRSPKSISLADWICIWLLQLSSLLAHWVSHEEACVIVMVVVCTCNMRKRFLQLVLFGELPSGLS